MIHFLLMQIAYGAALVVSGLDFDVDEFLKTTVIKPFSVFHKGKMVIGPDQTQVLRSNSGFIVLIDLEGAKPLNHHIQKANDYLKIHRTTLKKSAQFGADDLRLNFFYPNLKVYDLAHYLPPDLLLLAGRIGIGIEMSAIDYSKVEPQK
jgi:hypothetical protein